MGRNLLQILTLFLVLGCAHKPPDSTLRLPRLWIPDPEIMAIRRQQENAMISCAAENIGDFVCMSWDDYTNLLFRID